MKADWRKLQSRFRSRQPDPKRKLRVTPNQPNNKIERHTRPAQIFKLSHTYDPTPLHCYIRTRNHPASNRLHK